MRAVDGEMTLKTRKGLDWTSKYPAIAKTGGKLPDAIIDGEICALDENGAPDFAALQAALSEGNTDFLVYFAFDLLFEGGEDLRTLSLTDRKERLQQLLSDAGEDARLRSSSISRLVVKRCCARPAVCPLKESCRNVATRPTCLVGQTRG